MLLNLDEVDKVVGEIYKITNTITNKYYIGQTRSHRKNHKKYRPFGYLGRFNAHISEAYSNKPNQCRFLNSSIRKYGSDKFICDLILTCKVEELDMYERQNISVHNTKYPNGYNLTDGGQCEGQSKGTKIKLDDADLTKPPEVRLLQSFKKSDFTKKLISERLKSAKSDIIYRKGMMENSQNQHKNKKIDLFKNVKVYEQNLEKYIHVITNNKENYQYIRIVIDKIKTTFVGKYETIQQIKQRAITFIKELIERQDTLLRETP